MQTCPQRWCLELTTALPRRHWQDAGYLIVYVTGRPDMQKHRVVAWLSQHNFPHGVVSFCDGLTHDPLRQKAMFLQSLVQEVRLGRVPPPPSPRPWARGRPIWSHPHHPPDPNQRWERPLMVLVLLEAPVLGAN